MSLNLETKRAKEIYENDFYPYKKLYAVREEVSQLELYSIRQLMLFKIYFL